MSLSLSVHGAGIPGDEDQRNSSQLMTCWSHCQVSRFVAGNAFLKETLHFNSRLWVAESPRLTSDLRVSTSMSASQRFRTDLFLTDTAGILIADMGKTSGVKASPRKFASARGPRRSIGARWAPRVKAGVLMDLIRHESLQTTLRYYADEKAETLQGASGRHSKQQNNGSQQSRE